ncbi:hypothetical protein [Mesorhizobium sp. Mes31]|uniref:hypothetical protein n=1 Tax=Mesorhizobium sp. Mes31 TaxID=2926017 RepID=UPI0021188887|nr:hypothetical protein [Mesorhizobium sp. Mes31]
MTHFLTIDFDPEQAETDALIHRVRNFGEDVYRYLRTTGWGEIKMAEVDAAMTQLIIRDIKGSKLRRVRAWIVDEMNRHHLSGVISN